MATTPIAVTQFNFTRTTHAAAPRKWLRAWAVIEQPIRMLSCDTLEKISDDEQRALDALKWALA